MYILKENDTNKKQSNRRKDQSYAYNVQEELTSLHYKTWIS